PWEGWLCGRCHPTAGCPALTCMPSLPVRVYLSAISSPKDKPSQYKFADPVIQPLVEFAWCEYLQEKKKELRGEVWAYASSVMCFVDGQLLGDEKELLKWSHREWDYHDFKPEALYQAIAEDFYRKHLKNSQASNQVALLFSDACPRTCENFRALCAGGAKSRCDGRELTYKNSLFHRLVKNGWIQGGVNSCKGSDTTAAFHPQTLFLDESFSICHKGRGILGMANKGRHSNGSQFYITLQPAPYLDKKYVAFGQLIEGTEVLQRLEAVPTYKERPTVACRIMNCGTLEP
uniref:Peptidyl-prolyl cis-trans isomerase n=1 Tax=Falco tinnunculus TaxID=100819 RepID=A0A8C4TZF3_FALTI